MQFLYPKSDISKRTIFHPRSLAAIRPFHIVQWLQTRAYGVTPVDYNDKVKFKPKGARASSLEQAKKAVSFYMNQQSMAWNGTFGNPTQIGRAHV